MVTCGFTRSAFDEPADPNVLLSLMPSKAMEKALARDGAASEEAGAAGAASAAGAGGAGAGPLFKVFV